MDGHGGGGDLKGWQGSHSHEKSWKTMEKEKKNSRLGKVMEIENLAKSYG